MAMQDMYIWLGPINALATLKTHGHNQDEVNLPAVLVNVRSLLQQDRVIVHEQNSAAPHVLIHTVNIAVRVGSTIV